MLSDIQKADPHARRQAMRLLIWVLLIGLPVLVACVYYETTFRDWLLRGESHDVVRRLKRILTYVVVSASATLLGLAFWLWRLGLKVKQAQRFPLPGMSVVRDTRVYTGRSAFWYARGCRLIALVLVGLTITMYWLIWGVMQLLDQLITK